MTGAAGLAWLPLSGASARATLAGAEPEDGPAAAPPPAAAAFWTLPAADLMAALGSSARGLSSEDAVEARRRYGPNVLKAARRYPALRIFITQFGSPLVLVLLVASVIAFLVGDVQDATIIWAIVIASCVLSFFQEYRASQAMERLRHSIAPTAAVLRDGTEVTVPAEEVVPGDILCLSAGDLIAADGVVLDATELEVGQAVLTGESFPAEKKPGTSSAESPLANRINVVFSGTSVRSGQGRALAVLTGGRTEFSQIAETLERQEAETEFAVGIRRFGYLMMQIMLVLIVVIFSANLLLHRALVESLLFSLALAVGLTPELLPAIVTVTLAHGARAMERDGVIVRRLAAIENLGSMDVLCTDKTGTLTEGIIRLDAAVDADGAPSEEVMLWAALNAAMETGLANPLDEAVRAAEGFPAAEVGRHSKIDEIPYDFVRKSLSVVCRRDDAAEDLMVTKGALANILSFCGSIRTAGSVRPLGEADKAALDDRLRAWSDEGYRVLGVATRTFSPGKSYGRADEQGLVFSGFLLFQDTPKNDAAAVLAALASRGIRTKIISGDNRHASRHLASHVGLPCQHILTGPEMLHMGDDVLFARAHRTDIFCELDPNQKERIVAALRRRGHVVGYLGDGINDAPALMVADIGISVDTAVDVAREAADIVLLQKDLAVLLQGVEDGRRTFANTMKYIFIATSSNFGNMVSMAIASLGLPFLPMLAKQILLNNFLSDIPSLAIAGDGVDPELVARPRRWDIASVRRFMVIFGLASSFFDLATFAVLLYVGHVHAATFQTGWFVESLVTQTGTVLVVRTRRAAWQSRPARLLAGAALAVVLLAGAIPYLPIAPAFGFVPIPLHLLAALAALAAGYFVTVELLKRRFYAHPHRPPRRHWRPAHRL